MYRFRTHKKKQRGADVSTTFFLKKNLLILADTRAPKYRDTHTFALRTTFPYSRARDTRAVKMLSSSSSSSSSSSVLSSSRPLQRRGIQRHASSNGRIQRSQLLRASSTSRDVTTIANVSVPMQILKPNGEPKVVYIFNSKACDGSAELKDILGNKCVLCSFCLLGKCSHT